jgi:hypothetical protein
LHLKGDCATAASGQQDVRPWSGRVDESHPACSATALDVPRGAVVQGHLRWQVGRVRPRRAGRDDRGIGQSQLPRPVSSGRGSRLRRPNRIIARGRRP